MLYNKNEAEGIIRGYIKGRIKERGTTYALRVAGDPDFLDSEVQDVKEFLTYEQGIDFEEDPVHS